MYGFLSEIDFRLLNHSWVIGDPHIFRNIIHWGFIQPQLLSYKYLIFQLQSDLENVQISNSEYCQIYSKHNP